jgi:hypothetical protein
MLKGDDGQAGQSIVADILLVHGKPRDLKGGIVPEAEIHAFGIYAISEQNNLLHVSLLAF